MKRYGLLWLLTIAFIWLAVTRFTELQKLIQTLAQGRPGWVLAAALLQVLYYLVYTALYQAGFHTVEVESRLLELVPVTFGSIFINVVVPSGGASGAALFVDDAVRRGQSGSRTAAGTILVTVLDLGAFVLVLLAGLTYLFLKHLLAAYQVIAAVILVSMTVGLAGSLGLGIWLPKQLYRLFVWWQGSINRIAYRLGLPQLLTEDWAERNTADFSQAARAVANHPARLGQMVVIGLALHLVDVATLSTLFLAFHQPVIIGPIVAGYTIGTLFLIVSPTPMGIGFVEGLMPLAFISLGLPGEAATAITLTFRGLNFWLPLVLGFILLQRVRSFSTEKQTTARVWNVRVIAILTALMGMVNILSAVTPSLSNRLAIVAQFSPLLIRRGSHLTAALAGFALLLLASSLWRHKQTAWLLTLLVLVISAVSHVVKGLDYEEATLAAGLAIWLFTLRPYFHARSDLPSIQQGLRVVLVALLFTLAYGTVGFYLLDRHFSVNFSLAAALRQTVVMFSQFYDPGLEPLTGFGRFFASSIYLVGAVTLGYGLVMLARPVLIRRPATASQKVRARAVVEAYGRSSLARMTLFNDKSYYFSPGGSVVAYIVRGRTAVALGDPIGPREDALATITGFKATCAGNDWLPAFHQTLPDYLDNYRAAGFKTLCIGNEAIVSLNDFSLAGKSNKDLRWTANRLPRLGYQAKIHPAPSSDDLLNELRVVSDEWLTLVHGREKQFSLGWFDDDYIRQAPVIAIHAPDGSVSAFANIVPEYQRNEITIDLMRHRPQAEAGTMDFLFISLLEWAKTQGYETVSLGLSPLSGVGQSQDDPNVERALHYIYKNVNQFYNFKGLHAFKEKFHPCWSPRYLVYPNSASLAVIALAISRASSGDSFVWDYLKDLIRKH